MAESAASLAVDKLVTLLTQEANLLKGIHNDVANIKDELQSIRAFLKDAESKAHREGIGEGAKAWVKQVREVAYLIEDAVDEYILHVAQHRDGHGFIAFLHKMAFLVKKLKSRHEIAQKIRDIKAKLEEIKKRSERYQSTFSEEGLSSSNRGAISLDPRLSSHFIEEAELVGIESQRNDLISYLVSGMPQRIVISLVGMGGVGKTTLAKKVYDSHTVRDKFQCQAWITVSQSYEEKELLRSILKKFYEAKNESFPESFVTMDKVSLITKLREYLQNERYLVVFDDVWEPDFWRIVEPGLLNNDKGSRILITTRNKDVATICRASPSDHVHQMEPLSQKEAWKLFCQKAFKFEVEGRCPKELEELSQDIVGRCGGLPLAIVVIGGLLATKEKSTQEWQKFSKKLGSALVSDPHLGIVAKILSLSYNDLPFQLKPCFLYLGMLPEDSSIKRRRVINLWVANGFVQGKEGMTSEEVALECLSELIHRSLVQVDAVSLQGIPKAYRVHDLVRDIILSKSEELSFKHVSRNNSTIKGIARHLSINNGEGESQVSNATNTQTRSIMLFDNGMEPPMPMINAIFSTCKHLTALDLEDCTVDHIPKKLGNLLHLKYLSLRKTKVSVLPKSIGKLHNLEYLDLMFSDVKELPVVVDRFPNLRHLLAFARGDDLLKIHGSIRQLEMLQSLCLIGLDDTDDGFTLINEIGMLKQLRKLGIGISRSEYALILCKTVEKLTHLRSLSVGFVGDEIPELQSVSSPPLQLQTLTLNGKLQRLPDWISKLHNLGKLHLLGSRLMDDSIKVIQALPNLKDLLFLSGYDGKNMYFEEGGLQKLMCLGLVGLNGLHTVTIDEGALPLLQKLIIVACPQLKEVPCGIQHLKNLKELYFAGMRAEFTQRLSRRGDEEGEDYWKVKHVPLLQYDGTYGLDDQQSFGGLAKRWF